MEPQLEPLDLANNGTSSPHQALNIPEVLSNILSYMDFTSLKEARLVSRFWDNHAGYLLSRRSWVVANCKNTDQQDSTKLDDLHAILETSRNPSNFFVRFYIDGDFAPGQKLHEILEKYGHHLKTLNYTYWYVNSTDDGSSYTRLLLHRVFTEWCLNLEELFVEFNTSDEDKISLKIPVPALDFPNALKIRVAEFRISKFTKPLQDFFTRVLKKSPKLKELRIFERWQEVESEAFSFNLGELKVMTSNLEKFSLVGREGNVHPETISKYYFGKNLKELRLDSLTILPRDFQRLLESASGNLTTLDLGSCNFIDEQDSTQNLYSKVFRMIINTLPNLQTLKITTPTDRSDDDLFGTITHADDTESSKKLNEIVHPNLKRLALSWSADSNITKLESVRTLAKWFPNITLLSMCLGIDFNNEVFLQPELPAGVTIMMGIKLQEVVEALQGLTEIQDLHLRVCGNVDVGDLNKTLIGLQAFPKLLCCSLTEFGMSTQAEQKPIVHHIQEIQDGLMGLQALNVIRLVGFKFENQDETVEFVRNRRVSLEIYKKYVNNLLWENDLDFRGITSKLSKKTFLVEY